MFLSLSRPLYPTAISLLLTDDIGEKRSQFFHKKSKKKMQIYLSLLSMTEMARGTWHTYRTALFLWMHPPPCLIWCRSKTGTETPTCTITSAKTYITLHGKLHTFRELCKQNSAYSSSWGWRLQWPLKRLYTSTKLHGANNSEDRHLRDFCRSPEILQVNARITP
jgi:hypothetical protein